MPSLTILDSTIVEKIKEKKKKKTMAVEISEVDSRKKKKEKSGVDSLGKELKSVKKKKRKEREEEDRSETSSELVDSIKPNGVSKKLNWAEEVDGSGDEYGVWNAEVEDDNSNNPNALCNFKITKPLKEKLESKGINSLFPIQAMTFDTILSGSDLVGRARTGQGKTLAFVLPILESLVNGHTKESRKTGYGRAPSVLVLVPTRELAKQVHSDFEVYGGSLGMTSCCVYGGAPYSPQELSLRRGIDIIVGTPGRIKDHIEKGTLDLKFLQFRVLDEADEMLKMGFVDDVELILGKVEDVSKVQTLLFSATLPHWVKDIAARFLKPNKKTADLVGNEKLKASATVRHIVLPCFHSAKAQVIPDIIRCYSGGGRTIVFTETKSFAAELADLLTGARALHGDIQQSQREVTLAAFRKGKFLVLVATNVAARGLDISEVQLIIQCEPPRDVEDYIHRSGRTGRAGNTGVAVLLYDPKKSFIISKIERESGVKFEHISAPQPADIAEAAGFDAANAISDVSDKVIPTFRSVAEKLITSSGLSPVDLLAKAIAKATGFTELKKRSLLTSLEDYATLLLETGGTIYTPSFAFSVLRRFLPEDKINQLKGLSLTADGKGAVFDIPADDLDLYIEGQKNAANVKVSVLKVLPPLQEKTQQNGGSGWQGGRFSNGGNFSNRRGGGRFSGGRGGNHGRFSDRRSNGFSSGSRGGFRSDRKY